jgi:diguanylate cyclase (GGDEF)-like protein
MVSRQRILALAMHDRLTGLPIRRLFDDRLSQALSAARRHGRIGALLLIDLDRFNPVNDSYGHLAGDLVLVRAGQRLAGLVRGSDSVSRLGGDEFAVILQEINSPEEAVLIAQRAIEALGELAHLPDGRSVVPGASAGVGIFPHGQETLTALFEPSDQALYASEKKGGTCVTLAASAAQ